MSIEESHKERERNTRKKRKLDSPEMNQILQDEYIDKSLNHEMYIETNFNKKFNNKENKRTFFDDSIINDDSPKIKKGRNSLTGPLQEKDKKRKNRFSFDGEISSCDTNPKPIDNHKKLINDSGLDSCVKSKIKRISSERSLKSEQSSNFHSDLYNISSKQAEIIDGTRNYNKPDCENYEFSIAREKCKNSKKQNSTEISEACLAEIKLAKCPNDTNTSRMKLRRTARNKSKSPKTSSEEELSDTETEEYEYEERRAGSVLRSKPKLRKISSEIELEDQETEECESDETDDNEIESKPPAPRPRGRPKKTDRSTASSKSKTSNKRANVEETLMENDSRGHTTTTTNSVSEPVSPSPRPKGRPKKQQITSEPKSDNDTENFEDSEILDRHDLRTESVPTKPRPRGRPRKEKNEKLKPKFTPTDLTEQSSDSESEDYLTPRPESRTDKTVSPKPRPRGRPRKQPIETKLTSRNRAKQSVEIEEADNIGDFVATPRRSKKSVSSTPHYGKSEDEEVTSESKQSLRKMPKTKEFIREDEDIVTPKSRGRSRSSVDLSHETKNPRGRPKKSQKSESRITPKKNQNLRKSNKRVESCSQSSDSEDSHNITPKSSRKSASATPRPRKIKERSCEDIVLPRRSLRLQEKAIKQAIENELKQNSPQCRTPLPRTPQSKSKTRNTASTRCISPISKTNSASKKKANYRSSEKKCYSMSPYVPKRVKKLEIASSESDVESDEEFTKEEDFDYTKKKIKIPVRKTRSSNRL